ncbi:MAG: hypothetical protein WC214_07535, partial [Candidatus Omnitrophota bacterium]
HIASQIQELSTLCATQWAGFEPAPDQREERLPASKSPEIDDAKQVILLHLYITLFMRQLSTFFGGPFRLWRCEF